MTGPGGTEADRAAREALAREARATATALLDWVGTRVDGASTTRAAGAAGTSARPSQSAGPCTWCPVCALVAAVRGEQPELTAHLAEQASALLVVLRLLLQSHAHQHPAEYVPHEHPAHRYAASGDELREHPAHGAAATADAPAADAPFADPARVTPAPAAGSAAPSQERAPGPDAEPVRAEANGSEVPRDVAPHAMFDPTPRVPTPEGAPRAVPERPTGKRGPRPSPRLRPAGTEPAATDATAPSPEGQDPAPARRPTPAAPRAVRGVQRIPVRRRSRPC